MLSKWLVYYFWPMVKEPRVGRQIKISLQIRFVIRQISLVPINWLWLVGALQDFWGCIHVLWKVCSDTSVISARVAGWQSMCYIYVITGPHRNWLVVPKKRKVAAGGEGNVILLQCRSILQKGERGWEELPPGPILETQNCLVTELAEGRKEGLENRRWMWKGVQPPTLGILPLWTHAKPRSPVLVSLTWFTFTLGRDPGTIRQKEGYLNVMLKAISLLRNCSQYQEW